MIRLGTECFEQIKTTTGSLSHLIEFSHLQFSGCCFNMIYFQCLQNEYFEQIKTININCTPPWLHENKSFWCQNINIGKEENGRLNFLLQSIKTGNAKKGKCLPNCRSIRFFVWE